MKALIIALLTVACAGCGGAPVENVTALATPAATPSVAAPVAKPPAVKAETEISDAELEAFPGARDMPKDVQRYVVQRGNCEHWTGEEPYDATRKAEIEANVTALCTGLDARAEALRRQHADEPAVRRFLAGLDTIGM